MEISTLGTISILPVGVEESKRTTARMPLSMHSAERNRVVLMTEFEYRGGGVCSALAGWHWHWDLYWRLRSNWSALWRNGNRLDRGLGCGRPAGRAELPGRATI